MDSRKSFFTYVSIIYEIKNLKEATLHFYNKKFIDLDKTEKTTMILMIENPSLYNPLRKRPSLINKVNRYKKILTKNKN